MDLPVLRAGQAELPTPLSRCSRNLCSTINQIHNVVVQIVGLAGFRAGGGGMRA